MRTQMNQWQHLFKLDPAKDISDNHLAFICESGTDAIVVGGTDRLTLDNVLNLLLRVKKFALPCILEVSELEAITPGFDAYLIPMVMNSRDKKWMMDIQHQAIKRYETFIDWEDMLFEGYCILNEQAKAFQHANCFLADVDDVVAYAQMAEHVFHLPIFYIEYSGIYGQSALVARVQQELQTTKLFYGGGIETSAQAREMKKYADCIIVGNSIYTNFNEALRTVQAVKYNQGGGWDCKTY